MKYLFLAAGLLGLASCSKKDYPTSANHLLQGTWRLQTTEGNDTAPTTTTKPVVTKFKPGDIVDVWTATTVEEYAAGKAQGAIPYTLAGHAITLKTAQGGVGTGQIVRLTKNKLQLARPQNTTLTGGPGTSIVICTYVK